MSPAPIVALIVGVGLGVDPMGIEQHLFRGGKVALGHHDIDVREDPPTASRKIRCNIGSPLEKDQRTVESGQGTVDLSQLPENIAALFERQLKVGVEVGVNSNRDLIPEVPVFDADRHTDQQSIGASLLEQHVPIRRR